MEGPNYDVWIEIARRGVNNWETITSLLTGSKNLQAITRSFTKIIDEGGDIPLVPEQLLQFDHLEEVRHPIEIVTPQDVIDVTRLINNNRHFRYITIQFSDDIPQFEVLVIVTRLLTVYKHLTFELFLWDNVNVIIKEDSLCLFGAASAISYNNFIDIVNRVRPIKRLFIAFNLSVTNTITNLLSLEELSLDFTNSPGFSHYNPATGRYYFYAKDIIQLLERLEGGNVSKVGFYVGNIYEREKVWNYSVTDEFIDAFKDYTFTEIRVLDFPVAPRYLGAIKEIFPNLQEPLLEPPMPGEYLGTYRELLERYSDLYETGYRLLPQGGYPLIPNGRRVETTLYTNIVC